MVWFLFLQKKNNSKIHVQQSYFCIYVEEYVVNFMFDKYFYSITLKLMYNRAVSLHESKGNDNEEQKN